MGNCHQSFYITVTMPWITAAAPHSGTAQRIVDSVMCAPAIFERDTQHPCVLLRKGSFARHWLVNATYQEATASNTWMFRVPLCTVLFIFIVCADTPNIKK